MITRKQKLKELRKSFREQVLKRDGHKCMFCNCKENLDAHHITNRNDLPVFGYVISNGITLCPKHHVLAEKYLQTSCKKCFKDFSPDKLYKMINSSYEQALSDCIKLKEAIIE